MVDSVKFRRWNPNYLLSELVPKHKLEDNAVSGAHRLGLYPIIFRLQMRLTCVS